MAKESGDTRGSLYNLTRNTAYGAYISNLDSYAGDAKLSYFSEGGHGHLIWLKGHGNEKSKAEIVGSLEYGAARVLADKGFEVILTPEGAQYRLAISKKKSPSGNPTYVEGTINATDFEQHSPSKTTVDGAYQSLKHANEKGADIALIYDHKAVLHRRDIAQGIHIYNQQPGEKVRFKAIIVVNAKHEVNLWSVRDDYLEKWK